MSGRTGGGWRARGRAAALMYASGAALAGLSMLPTPPPEANRGGILIVAGIALAAAVGILASGRHYTTRVSHVTSAAGTAIIASAISMAGGSYLGAVYAMFYIWVMLFSVLFYSRKGALGHATLCSAAVALGLAGLPAEERALTWALLTATLYIIVACDAFMRRDTKRLQGLIEHSGGVVTILNPDLTIAYHSIAAEHILGYGDGELVSRDLLGIVHPDDRNAVRAALEQALGQTETGLLECRVRHRDGSWRHVETGVENLLADAAVEGIVLSLRDVTDCNRLQEQLAYQAFHDPLTGLVNRALFTDRVVHALQRLDRSHSRPGVLVLDLDDFKAVNDSLGHAAGDQLLVSVADRLREALRASDTVARLGGDEFAVLVDACDSPRELAETARRLIDALTRPVMIDRHELVISPSIGGAIATTGIEEVSDLLRDADAAMYSAKGLGKGRYEAFEPGMGEEILRRAMLQSDLRRAVDRGELALVYQPIMDLASGTVRGVEALLRWTHPSLGPVAPEEFIPLAERTGAIVQLGRWALLEACAQAARWQRDHPRTPPLLMSVNVSGRQLEDDHFIDDVTATLASTGLEPCLLVLELTESILVTAPEATVERLQRLKSTGVTIALDDFGTGYSTLSYLKTLPVDVIKIDKSFVDDLVDRAEGRHELVEAILGLARSIDLPSVAEGIETEYQARQLKELTCEYGQGYLFSPPLPAVAARAWIDAVGRDHALGSGSPSESSATSSAGTWPTR